MPQELTFLSWRRERIAGIATGVQDGRARVETAITLTGVDAAGAPTSSVTRTVRFLLAGPGDVVGLPAGAITKRHPTPGAIDHESDRCAHIEFADPALAWRYTPAVKPAPGTGVMHPWLVLVVGLEGSELILTADQVALDVTVQQLHSLRAPTQPYRWAHVQRDAEGRLIGRVLSGRLLEAGTDYVAVLVPAFDAGGQKRWTGANTVTVPLYDHWRFRTATPPGSFEDLAARLQPGATDDETGRAPLDYPRVPTAANLQVRGALAPIGGSDDALDTDIESDLNGLRTPGSDEKFRPIVGLPRYGEAWRVRAPEDTTWGTTLNTDPRHRGVAGLGLEIGIRAQEELAAEASANLGALSEARQRIRDLVLGLEASATLWGHRMPVDPAAALWVLGPGLGRVVTADGPFGELATAHDRALPRGMFSAAARRMLRPGPARTARLAEGTITPAQVLDIMNRCPPPPEPADDGVPLVDLGIDLERLEALRREFLETGQGDFDTVLEQANELAEQAADALRDLAAEIVNRLGDAEQQGIPAPWAEALALLVAAANVDPSDEQEVQRLLGAMREFLARFPKPADGDDLSDLLAGLEEPKSDEPPCRPVDIAALSAGAKDAFDPTRLNGAARVRVLATIDGLDLSQPLSPPEICIGLDRPVWADVDAAFPEWLMPGVNALPVDSVIAVETNPQFVDSLLTGLNTQLLTELRWRNIPVASGCTPLRVFWDRAHTGTGDRIDDITGIRPWLDASDIGDAQHRPAGSSGRDLVVVIRGQLFLRYPATVVYLVTAEHAGVTDFRVDPVEDAAHVLPSFQGRIGADVTFFGFQGFAPADIQSHWLVFEEPPAGYRFANDVSTAVQAHTWAQQAFAQPVRVLIQGDRLDPEGPI